MFCKKGNNSKIKGFTLIELLVVVVILGILAGIGLSTFQTSQAKGRDSRRKSDLEQIQRALEMYANDKGRYPDSLPFGEEWVDDKGTVYMKEVPVDPRGSESEPGYCYQTEESGKVYKIYANLENRQDPALGNYTCGGESYNYGVASSNTRP